MLRTTRAHACRSTLIRSAAECLTGVILMHVIFIVASNVDFVYSCAKHLPPATRVQGPFVNGFDSLPVKVPRATSWTLDVWTSRRGTETNYFAYLTSCNRCTAVAGSSWKRPRVLLRQLAPKVLRVSPGLSKRDPDCQRNAHLESKFIADRLN